jgi:hypothetical protein
VRLYFAVALMLGWGPMATPLSRADPASPSLADATDRVARTVVVPEGTPLRIEATMATLTVTGSNRPDVQIEARARRRLPTARYPASSNSRATACT